MALALRAARHAPPLQDREPPRWRRMRRGDGLYRLRRRRDLWRPVLLGGAALASAAVFWWQTGPVAGSLPAGPLVTLRAQVISRAGDLVGATGMRLAGVSREAPPGAVADTPSEPAAAAPSPAEPAPAAPEARTAEEPAPVPAPLPPDDLPAGH